MTIAVDFDGTIVEHRYLEIGEKKLRRTNTAYADCRPSSAYIKVGGLSKTECEKLIHDRIIRYFEALALAGDLTIYGVRDHVKLIRKDTDGKRCE